MNYIYCCTPYYAKIKVSSLPKGVLLVLYLYYNTMDLILK